jgi:hypothetical protein
VCLFVWGFSAVRAELASSLSRAACLVSSMQGVGCLDLRFVRAPWTWAGLTFDFVFFFSLTLGKTLSTCCRSAMSWAVYEKPGIVHVLSWSLMPMQGDCCSSA